MNIYMYAYEKMNIYIHVYTNFIYVHVISAGPLRSHQAAKGIQSCLMYDNLLFTKLLLIVTLYSASPKSCFDFPIWRDHGSQASQYGSLAASKTALPPGREY